MIKNIKLFINNNSDKSIEIASLAKLKLEKSGFKITDDSFDLGIAIGGDGSFLRMVKNTDFDSNPYYIGINAGTLGFMQEVKPSEIDKLIAEIKDYKYKVDEIGIQETIVTADDNSKSFYSLNEILVRDEKFRVIKVALKIDGDLLENYTGDALLIATSCGSTAHNLSYGGSIIYNSISTLQITPVGPVNSKSYRSLTNSIIVPDYNEITLTPNSEYRDYTLTVDGESTTFKDIDEIKTTIRGKKIKMMRFSHYNFPQKINEKLLSN